MATTPSIESLYHMNQSIVLDGIPGSGKSTIIHKLINYHIEHYKFKPILFVNLKFDFKKNDNRLVESQPLYLCEVLLSKFKKDKVHSTISHYDVPQILKSILFQLNILSYNDEDINILATDILRIKQKEYLGIKTISTGVINTIKTKYNDFLSKSNCYDPCDLVYKTIQLIKKSKEARKYLETNFSHIFVDDYHDFNIIEQQLIHTLCSQKIKFTISVDSKLLINKKNKTELSLKLFNDLLKDSEIIELKHSFRLSHSDLNFSKQLFKEFNGGYVNCTGIPDSKKMASLLYVAYDVEEEARFIIDEIEFLKKEQGIDLDEIAIIAPFEEQLTTIEKFLKKNHVPYHFQHCNKVDANISFVMSCLKLIQNQHDLVSYLSIIKSPFIGLRQSTIEQIFNKMMTKNITKSLLSDIYRTENKKLINLMKILKNIINNQETLTFHQILFKIIHESNYYHYLTHSHKIETLEEIDIIHQLIDFLTANYNCIQTCLHDFVERPNITNLELGSTLTLSKFSEFWTTNFKAIIFVGFENGLIPHYEHQLDDDEIVHDYQHFFEIYSKATSRFYLTVSNKRKLFGEIWDNDFSPIIQMYPHSLLQCFISERFKNQTNNYTNTLNEHGIFHSYKSVSNHHDNIEMSSKLSLNDLVEHPRWGVGHVIEIDDQLITVKFDNITKQLLIKYSHLQKLSN